jgi:hypothetical protein
MQSNDTPTELRQRLQASLNRSVQTMGPAIATLCDVRLRGDLILGQNPPFEAEVLVITRVLDDRCAGQVPAALYSNGSPVDLCDFLYVTLAGMRSALTAEQRAELDARIARTGLGKVHLNNELKLDRDAAPPTSGTVH